MQPPFTAEQFLDVFRRYNVAVWPAQIFLNAVALAAALACWRAGARASSQWARVALVLVATLWMWSGVVYHKGFFARLSPAGEIFGSLFVTQAALLLLIAWSADRPLERVSRSRVAAAAAIIVYALVLYPLAGLALGHRYPVMPSFGAPCPVTIFTFGIFLLMPISIPRFAFAIPVIWSVVGLSAVANFGMKEDAGLIIAAVVTLIVLTLESGSRSRRSLVAQ